MPRYEVEMVSKEGKQSYTTVRADNPQAAKRRAESKYPDRTAIATVKIGD